MRRLQRIARRIAQGPIEVFCDMDGVLTDLMGKVSEITGQQFPDHGQAMRGLVRVRRNPAEYGIDPQDFAGGALWNSLGWTPNGKKLWAALQSYNPTLLTGAIGKAGAAPGKVAWAERELGLPSSKVILSASKPDYAHPNAVLIDDTPKQIRQWEEAGGIGILHSDSTYQQTLQKVREAANSTQGPESE